MKDILKNISRGQLTNFLPGGRCHNLDNPAVREKMAHSKMNNLMGEQCFGELDFSLFKRRNTTVLHHSTINILKRNKSISQYFCLKSKEDQTQLLKLSAKKASKLRKQHVTEEKEAVVQRTLVLQESRANKAAAADRKRAKLQDVMEKMRPHHGPCLAPEDVDHLLTIYATRKNQLQAVKAELRYQKLVLQFNSPLLRVTGTLQQLVRNHEVVLWCRRSSCGGAHSATTETSKPTSS